MIIASVGANDTPMPRTGTVIKPLAGYCKTACAGSSMKQPAKSSAVSD
jgi:hypothetical protein